jgi:PadR family transcriptional regulator, regulatory protein PadR
MSESMHLLRGTLDALIMKAVSAGPLHGYGIADFVHETTRGVLEIEDGALYRALHRLEERGVLAADWGVSAQGRRARFYRLTAAGQVQLATEQRDWERYAEAVGRVFASRGAGS